MSLKIMAEAHARKMKVISAGISFMGKCHRTFLRMQARTCSDLAIVLDTENGGLLLRAWSEVRKEDV
jgi:hypothetical protein